MLKHLRSKLLNIAFQMLYGHLVFFHELAGRVLWGSAWNARRVFCVDEISDVATCIDLGAGEGRLIREATKRMYDVRGVEPSDAMRASAWSNAIYLRTGSSIALPFASKSIDAITITYPGDWIFLERSWLEIERVTSNAARIVILIGGDYTSGPGAPARRLLSRISYGRSPSNDLQLSAAERAGFNVCIKTLSDCWGECILLIAERPRD
jgi:SAM-dependent methyltransferase